MRLIMPVVAAACLFVTAAFLGDKPPGDGPPDVEVRARAAERAKPTAAPQMSPQARSPRDVEVADLVRSDLAEADLPRADATRVHVDTVAGFVLLTGDQQDDAARAAVEREVRDATPRGYRLRSELVVDAR